jgi:hypothetical protein
MDGRDPFDGGRLAMIELSEVHKYVLAEAEQI